MSDRPIPVRLVRGSGEEPRNVRRVMLRGMGSAAIGPASSRGLGRWIWSTRRIFALLLLRAEPAQRGATPVGEPSDEPEPTDAGQKGALLV